MYLKSIEVQGFKSFANKMLFEFHNGITGIVGPNGSGKSNIGDAVRWVLGEQSAKQLRGGKMEDVIFSGTELRKPVSYASVAITIDNSDHALAVDFDQVTIARKVYRSGESEYLINGSNCRLRDINELFYDTGIGKEGYSIIGQGQIDRILSGKPEERRELFDEAAGIVKFKRRKASAQKKLDDENQNLVRVNDILAELEKQVGPLERQSEKAKVYLKYKEELKSCEIELFVLDNEKVKDELKKHNDNLLVAQEELEKVRAAAKEVGEKHSENEEHLRELNRQIDECSQKSHEADIEKNRLLSQIDIIREQIKSADANDSALKQRLASIRENIFDKEEEKQRYVKALLHSDDNLNDFREKANAEDEKLKGINDEILRLDAESENAKNEVFNILGRLSSINSQIAADKTLLGQLGIRKSQLNAALIDFKSQESAKKQDIDSLSAMLGEIESKLLKCEDDFGKNLKLISEYKENITGIGRRIDETNHARLAASSKLETLKNITERYDGYGNSIRRVMEQKDSNKGIIGVVADIFKTKKQYETAIETALGGTIQNIVTDTEETAKKMISFLKQTKSGRATFLPLSAIKGKEIRPDKDMEAQKGFIGFAGSLVECDKEFEQLKNYLLGRILVVDNIDNALAIARRSNYSQRIVTLEGDMLSPGGSMSGGAFKNNSNLLGRRREIEDLEKTIKESDLNLSALENRLNELKKKREELVKGNEELKEKINQLTLEKNNYENHVKNTQEKFEQLVKESGNSHREAGEIEKNSAELKAKISSAESDIEAAEYEKSELEKTIEANAVLVENQRALLEKQRLVVEQMHIKLSTMEQDSYFAEENAKRVIRELGRLENDAKNIESEIEDSLASVEKKKQDIDTILETIEKGSSIIEELNAQNDGLRKLRDEIQAEQKKLFSDREELSKSVNGLDKECLRLEGIISNLNKENDARIDYMWTEYEITPVRAIELSAGENRDYGELKKVILETKSEIRKLGDVNVNAIEDYKEVSERYTFLKTQHDDIIEASNTLMKIIDELDAGMRKQFNEKFNDIKVEFDKVFKELFGGGRGTIELDNEDDVLESGIRIISQPPGKKLQNMMQLSGGEKALTAISLLFAIQNLKPSPFCLLDEIEAALDDSNVVRFAKYLHKLTKNTQFIVITHRRGTMAAADRLYGITMQEKGVSTLVSVDLIEDQLDNEKK